MMVVSLLGGVVSAQTVNFGSGANSFDMEFVDVGNAGNAADDTGYGAVAYAYQMGKYEVSEKMIDSYNASNPGILITMDNRGDDKPASNVSWNEAARFVNWLNTSTGGVVAYNFSGSGANDNITLWTSGDVGYDASNPYRNSLAKYVLPSEDEWYKAAYHSPTGYTDYATQSDTAPTAVASGTGAGTAVYNQTFTQGPADIMDAGGLSFYGTMAQNGNAWEWAESNSGGDNDSAVDSRLYRGGRWLDNDPYELHRYNRSFFIPTAELYGLGFRVAVVPEPSATLLMGIGAFGLLITRKRR